MLPKSYRLSRPDFLRTRSSGKRSQEKFCNLIYQENKIGHLRIAIEISNRIDKRATFRNHLRRLIFSGIGKERVINKSIDLIVIMKPEIKGHPQELLLSSLLNTLVKIFE